MQGDQSCGTVVCRSSAEDQVTTLGQDSSLVLSHIYSFLYLFYPVSSTGKLYFWNWEAKAAGGKEAFLQLPVL